MRPARAVLLAVALVPLAAACGGAGGRGGDAGGKATKLAVAVTAKGCRPRDLEAVAGRVSVAVKNGGDEELEFEILDGSRVVEEVENIAPGFERSFTVDLDAGSYTLVCGANDAPRGQLRVTGAKKATETAAPTGTAVHASLKDYAISPSPASAPAGTVRFLAHNESDKEHELVVAETDLAPEALPVKGDEVDEDGLDRIGELEDVKAGQAPVLALDLKPGNYVLFCNLPGHYRKGMHAGFTVT